jgi:hypothetical protein
VSAEVYSFLRISNSDVLQSMETTECLITVADERHDLRAVANTKQDWGMAWERGIRPIKQAALESMRADLREIDSSMPEDSDTYRAAMVLLASEFVGPYPDRIITFTVYPGEFVDAIGVRLWKAKIWEADEVRCEGWFDPETGGIAFVRDVMIAEGKLVRQWSSEKNQYLYYSAKHYCA